MGYSLSVGRSGLVWFGLVWSSLLHGSSPTLCLHLLACMCLARTKFLLSFFFVSYVCLLFLWPIASSILPSRVRSVRLSFVSTCWINSSILRGVSSFRFVLREIDHSTCQFPYVPLNWIRLFFMLSSPSLPFSLAATSNMVSTLQDQVLTWMTLHLCTECLLLHQSLKHWSLKVHQDYLCITQILRRSKESQTLVTQSTSRLLVHHSNTEKFWIVHIMLAFKVHTSFGI